jgi:hypothetical protein
MINKRLQTKLVTQDLNLHLMNVCGLLGRISGTHSLPNQS